MIRTEAVRMDFGGIVALDDVSLSVSEGELFSIIGPTSDCIVVSRPRLRGSGPARAFLLSALLRSGRPLLVLPQKLVSE